ncbi:MAG: hypothetical protein ABSF84_16560 [Acidimicrobiales bacterium]|jgi:hypothetical protein
MTADTDRSGRHGWRSLVVGGAAYLALAVALWWNVWSDHPTSTTTCGCGDTSLFTWFVEWPAYALAHGMDPLYSTYLFHPTGINLLANTGVVGIGIVLAPVTWAFGPIATINVAVTFAPFLSALAMYVLLRRWVSWSPAAFAGGLLYGFSPFLVVSITDAHLMLGMAPVPPLLVLCLDELFVRQRWRPWVTGVAIGGLALVQFMVGTEVLVLTAIAAAAGTVLVVLRGLCHRELLAARAPYAVRGAAAAVVSGAVLLAYPAWFALAGPAHLSGGVWGSGGLLSYGGNTLGLFVHPMVPSARITALTHELGGYQAPTLSDQYLGFGLVGVLVVGLVLWRRDLRLWLFGAVGILAAFLSVGLSFRGWTLWRLFVRAPLLGNVIPSRFGLVVYLCAAVMLGVVCDHTFRSVAALTGRAVVGGAATVAVAAVALVPIVSYFADGLPLTATPVRLPAWFETVAPRLPEHQVLLVFPFAFRQSNMTWQAVDRMSFAMVGGGGPDSIAARAGTERAGQTYLSNVSLAGGPQPIVPGEIAAVRHALDGWGVTGVVLPDPRPLPEYERVFLVRTIVVLMTAATGQEPIRQAGAWVWTGVDHAGPAAEPSAAQLVRCTAGSADGTVGSIRASAACVLAPAPTS